MAPAPESLTELFITAVLVAWPVALGLIWFLRRYYFSRLDRLGESTSEEMLDELENAFAPSGSISIRTQTEYLPYVFETIRENIDTGFADQQVQTLLERIDNHRAHEERQAVFPIEANQVTSDLRLRWTRDPSDRIELHIDATPGVIAALRLQKKRIPKAKLAKKKA